MALLLSLWLLGQTPVVSTVYTLTVPSIDAVHTSLQDFEHTHTCVTMGVASPQVFNAIVVEALNKHLQVFVDTIKGRQLVRLFNVTIYLDNRYPKNSIMWFQD